MHHRENALNQWLKDFCKNSEFILKPLAGDASFRRYFRLYFGEHTYVVMDAPPEKEPITPFINISKTLTKNGIHTPQAYATEYTQGFALLEDFGDQPLLKALTPQHADFFYKIAINTLMKIQQCSTDVPALPHFDKAHMLQELALFQQWFVQNYLQMQLSLEEEQLLHHTFDWLINEINQQPQVFIHRDYHSRNLMVIVAQETPDLGVIDFQDAMRGPFTYDLVSLLKDCYIQWPREQILAWITYAYHLLPNTHECSLAAFIRAFDLCGLQRHLKVLGIFCRLHLRDKKSAYLLDLPLTFNYVKGCAENYDELQPFYQFLQQKIYLPFMQKHPS